MMESAMSANRLSSRFKLAALLLALAAIAAPAWADGGRHGHDNDRDRNDRDRHGHDRRHDDRGDRHHRRYVHVPGWRQLAYLVPSRVYRQRYAAPPARVYYRIPGPRWQRGTRYYSDGYAPTYVVRDYGYYGLRQPPRGYYWRRDDRGGFLLVAVASGVIADLVLRGGY